MAYAPVADRLHPPFPAAHGIDRYDAAAGTSVPGSPGMAVLAWDQAPFRVQERYPRTVSWERRTVLPPTDTTRFRSAEAIDRTQRAKQAPVVPDPVARRYD